jgi:Zn-dependent protease
MLNDIFRNLDWSILTNAVLSVIPALVCITIHELAHGYTAYRLGDNTAKDMGRLTLNPIKHIDIFGLLMMLVFRFGWAKPVPVDMRNFRKPRTGMAITAVAGPLSNIVLAAFVLFVYGLLFVRLGGLDPSGTESLPLDIIQRTAYLSVALAVFNLMPIPPLDGSKVLFSFLSERTYYKLMRYERYGMILLIIVLNTNMFRSTIGRLTMELFERLAIIAQAAFNLVN